MKTRVFLITALLVMLLAACSENGETTDPSITFVTGESGRETTEFVTALNTWEKYRRFVVSRVLKDEKDRAQLSFLEGKEYDYFFFVANTEQSSEEVVDFYEKRGNCENYTRKPSMTWRLGTFCSSHFGPTKRSFN